MVARLGLAARLGRWAAVGVVLFAWPSASRATAGMPPALEARILLRALSYDYNFKQRVGDKIVVGIVHQPGAAPSVEMARQRLKAFKTIKAVLFGRPIDAVSVPFRDARKLTEEISKRGIDVLYICAGLEKRLAAINTVGRASRVVTVAGVKRYIRKGTALGVFVEDKRPKLWVNLTAAGRQGSKFAGPMLRLANVVR